MNTKTQPADEKTIKSIIIPVKTHNTEASKIKLLANHLNITNNNEILTILAISNLFIIEQSPEPQLTQLTPQTNQNLIPVTLTGSTIDLNTNQQIDPKSNTINPPTTQSPNTNPKLFKNIPFKNTQLTQNQILSCIISINPTCANKLGTSGINMILSKLVKKGALTRMEGYYTLNPAFNDIDNVNQIVFRFV